MNKKAILILSIIMSMGRISQVIPATLIFDLNGVLLNVDRAKASRTIGYSSFISYFFSGYNPFRIKKDFFSFLDTISPRLPDTPLATDEGDCLLPQLMCDWMRGKYDSDEVRQIISFQLNSSQVGQGLSKSKKRVFQSLANFIFTPAAYIQAVRLNKRGMELVKACAAQLDQYGNRKHKLIILSNWDRQTFDLLIQDPSFGELFSLFDDILISANIGKIKPDIGIYLDLFCRHDLNPDYDQTYLIDDQLENVESFSECGKKTEGILCTDFKSLFKRLKTLEII